MLIYRIVNKINGKIYIGQTTRSIEERWNNHCNNKESVSAIAAAIKKYGRDSFKIEELAKADSQDQLDMLENTYIELNKSLAPDGYNLKTGGSNGVLYSDKSKKKMSESKLGSLVPDEVREKMSKAHKKRWDNDDGTLAKHRSEMVKKAWSDPNYRAKIHTARKKYWSKDENRVKASERGKNMASDPKYIKKVSNGVKKALSKPETKKKLADVHEKQKKKVLRSDGISYNSIKEAAVASNTRGSSIIKCIKGVYKTAGGFTWNYYKTNKELDAIFQHKRSNPDPSQQTVYIVSGIAGSGKSWVCNQLKDDPRFHYVSYDGNRTKTHMDMIRNAPEDKIVLYDLNMKTSTFIRRNCEEFNIHFVTILGDFLQVKQQLKDRGGKITRGTYSRWKVMKKRSKKYGEFSGSSDDVLRYLRSLT